MLNQKNSCSEFQKSCGRRRLPHLAILKLARTGPAMREGCKVHQEAQKVAKSSLQLNTARFVRAVVEPAGFLVRLAATSFGRIILHLVCLARDHRLQWHWNGIRREFHQHHSV
jgi:hypothetical protein